jgi:hypothetical protein
MRIRAHRHRLSRDACRCPCVMLTYIVCKNKYGPLEDRSACLQNDCAPPSFGRQFHFRIQYDPVQDPVQDPAQEPGSRTKTNLRIPHPSPRTWSPTQCFQQKLCFHLTFAGLRPLSLPEHVSGQPLRKVLGLIRHRWVCNGSPMVFPCEEPGGTMAPPWLPPGVHCVCFWGWGRWGAVGAGLDPPFLMTFWGHCGKTQARTPKV